MMIQDLNFEMHLSFGEQLGWEQLIMFTDYYLKKSKIFDSMTVNKQKRKYNKPVSVECMSALNIRWILFVRSQLTLSS